MEYLVVFSFHFFIMGSFVMFLSGLLGFLFPRVISFFVVIILSMLIGYIYSVIYEVPGLAFFSALFNGTLSLLALGFVKAYYYSKQKAQEISDIDL
ncbi:hypothetical protein A8F94_22745 [Bacillus sp. FJAT-27225]|uniref:hypothetical protein n=1 Tax=Bacillus sp. FJAT-27225 TaxID=1743144 RepID=UPI00080C2995|nr:hypothetical protein [Bacillus sp. FJAT-27225]OCA81679.1 hypothetical protein A8F94_22745 [Bacillus sp. FJAT-27225]